MLRDYLLKYVNFTEEELDLITSKFHRQTISKNELFLQEGDICKKVAFVESGTLILSQTVGTGNEHVLDFFASGDMVSDYYSFLKKAPSDANIKASKKASLLVISKEDIEGLYNTVPNFEKLGRLLSEASFMQLAEGLKYAALPPRARYEHLIKYKPMIFENFPQYMIASYLGISPEWLSKIRVQK